VVRIDLRKARQDRRRAAGAEDSVCCPRNHRDHRDAQLPGRM